MVINTTLLVSYALCCNKHLTMHNAWFYMLVLVQISFYYGKNHKIHILSDFSQNQKLIIFLNTKINILFVLSHKKLANINSFHMFSLNRVVPKKNKIKTTWSMWGAHWFFSVYSVHYILFELFLVNQHPNET